ncbi:hypothetical protein V4C53_42535 [Paraburkholderia azotifigens]|uniref:hypothetical protein n=1 Tax=Paraburkholderia azotifigens TaxID=2057004 RepID=UPI0031777506
MNQARGRYAGPRRNGQRQPHHEKKPPPQRPGRPYVKAPPPDAAQTASIFKTRSFQFLVDAVGAENIAIALESNMTRVAELMKGERFTPETAFHMETTLGLPHGFFDQPNPALADETIARLKSPLDFVQIEGFDAESEAPEPAPVRTVDPQPVAENSLSEEAPMPKKVAGGSPRAVRNRRSDMPEQPESRAPLKASRSKDIPSAKAPQQQPLALSDSAEVENIRRANLRLLTRRNGSKVRLGVVMEMSGFNIADRLHGKKRMDRVEANRFTERLGLPVGWLDTPRSEGEIPEGVSRLLTPASRGRVSEKNEPVVVATNDDVPGTNDAKAHTPRGRDGAPGDPDNPSPVPADVAGEKEMIVVSPQARVSDFADDLAGRSPEETDGEARVATPATLESFPASAMPQRNPPLPFTSLTSLDNLHGIEPIAEALIKTLAGKARTGRLDELKALELLHQAVLL